MRFFSLPKKCLKVKCTGVLCTAPACYRNICSVVTGMSSTSSRRILLSHRHHARELEFCSFPSCSSTSSRSDTRPCRFVLPGISSSQVSVIAPSLPSPRPLISTPESCKLLLPLKWNWVKPPPRGFGRSRVGNFMYTFCDSSSFCSQVCGVIP